MKVYVTQGWADEDGTHEPGEELTFPDFEGDPTEHDIEGHKYAYLVNNGWVSNEAPTTAAHEGEPVPDDHEERAHIIRKAAARERDASAPVEEKPHRAQRATKKR